MPATVAPARRFVPATIDPTDLAALRSLFQQLHDRPLGSAAEVDRWLADFSELATVVEDAGTRRYINRSRDTNDPAKVEAYRHWIDDLEPLLKRLSVDLQKKLLVTPAVDEVFGRYEQLLRDWRADADLFRPENGPVEAQIATVVARYQQMAGNQTVFFEGKERTTRQMNLYADHTDRGIRESAWRATADRRLTDRDVVDSVFDELLRTRHRLATNAGLPGFRDFAWVSMKRFDYTPDDCLRFVDSVEAVCVPLVNRIDERRRRDLGVELLRPWDLAVDPGGCPSPRPFPPGQTGLLVEKTAGILRQICPILAGQFHSMRDRGDLDLESRPGKQPGGYTAYLHESGRPFILMNAAGLHRDVNILLHEAGHAFHALASSAVPLVFQRQPPIEFCEVASIAMELFGSEHFDFIYDDHTIQHLRRCFLADLPVGLTTVATVEAFQHWLYSHPGHSADERTSKWVELVRRFAGSVVDWSGLEVYRDIDWQRQFHLFMAPFYCIQYSIAQLAALGLWARYRIDPKQTLADYRAALALGGTQPLPALFRTAGAPLDFSEAALRQAMSVVESAI